jgi:hypothetical protein
MSALDRGAAPTGNSVMPSHVERGRMARTQRLMLAKWIQQRLCAPSPLA